MKKVIGIIIGLLVIGYILDAYIDNRATQKAERIEKEKVKEKTEEIIDQLISRNEAIEDWGEELSEDDKYRMDPILTIELEKVWLKSQPILFLGAVKDISTYDETRYEVVVEQNIFLNSEYFFTELQLSLVSDKNTIDAFLENHPDLLKDFGLNNGVAVVAKIESIESKNILSSNGETEEVKIGSGKLEEIQYIGKVRL